MRVWRRPAALVLAALSLTGGLGACAPVDPPPASEASRFKQEYEILNGQRSLDGDSVYHTVTVPDGARVIYADEASVRSLLDGGTGILYLGFPECPWCRTLLPSLFEAINRQQYKGAVYYNNTLEGRTNLRLEDGEIVTEKEGSALYELLLEKLGKHLGSYEGLGDPAIKRIYFPTTAFIKDGDVISVHLDTLPSQEDGSQPLTDAQREELTASLALEIQAIQ
ncbi:MAG: hypothetical protein LBH66_00655 [Oscillospiraceae bacterium]|jgi:hypothetical protein|nr:hypothetical protein [Oscillospiraceae bacterium]